VPLVAWRRGVVNVSVAWKYVSVRSTMSQRSKVKVILQNLQVTMCRLDWNYVSVAWKYGGHKGADIHVANHVLDSRELSDWSPTRGDVVIKSATNQRSRTHRMSYDERENVMLCVPGRLVHSEGRRGLQLVIRTTEPSYCRTQRETVTYNLGFY